QDEFLYTCLHQIEGTTATDKLFSPPYVHDAIDNFAITRTTNSRIFKCQEIPSGDEKFRGGKKHNSVGAAGKIQ
ncbi:hypothetical protein K0M31_013512, partial [Melipona bicolor]